LKDAITVRGFSRIQIGDGKTGKIVGDSKWRKNTITNDGLDNYVAGCVGKSGGSKQYQYMGLGTQTNTVNATQSELSGPLTTEVRLTMSPSTIATGTFQGTATWSSNAHTASSAIGGIAMYNTSAAGSMGAGNTYDVSTWASNQNISATYQLRFGGA